MDTTKLAMVNMFLAKAHPRKENAEDIINREESLVWLGYWLEKNFFGQKNRKLIEGQMLALVPRFEKSQDLLNAVAALIGNVRLPQSLKRKIFPSFDSPLKKIVAEKSLVELIDFLHDFGRTGKIQKSRRIWSIRYAAINRLKEIVAQENDIFELTDWLNCRLMCVTEVRQILVERIKALLTESEGAAGEERLVELLRRFALGSFFYAPILPYLKKKAKALIAAPPSKD
jgi:hypothetical protein